LPDDDDDEEPTMAAAGRGPVSRPRHGGFPRGFPRGPIVPPSCVVPVVPGAGKLALIKLNVSVPQAPLPSNVPPPWSFGGPSPNLPLIGDQPRPGGAAVQPPNLAGFQETQEQVEALVVRRHLRTPQKADVVSGTALNAVLPFLHRQASQSGGREVALDAEVLKKIQFTEAGLPDERSGPAGTLRRLDQVYWPFVLRGPTQAKLDDLLKQVRANAARGTHGIELWQEARKATQQLLDELRRKFHRGESVGGEYLKGKRVLDSLDSALAMIDQADVQRFCGDGFSVEARTVEELLEQMARRGLSFAPAPPGTEAAYHALHRALVQYAGDMVP
jgi:hypothetical protein